MSHDEFTKLYNYMERRFTEIDKRFERVDARFDQIYGLMDAFIKRQETQEQETAAVQNQLNHHDKWIHKLATKTSIGLN